MTWTSAFGRTCGRLLYAIVNRMALARISPNVLTFMGLVINVVAALLFGYATGETQRRMFFYAGLVVFAAGFFDLVDGRVARSSIRLWTGTVTLHCFLDCWSSTRAATVSFTLC